MHLIFQQYEERLNRRQAKPGTIRNLQRTASFFGESGLDPMTCEDYQIEEWLAGLPVSPRTRRLHAENLSAVFRYAVHRRVIQVAPTETVKLPREPDKEPRILENSELRKLLGQATHEQDWIMLHLFIYTGMRRAEAQNLTWDDVTWESIRITSGKGDKLRHIPVHPALAEQLVKVEAKGKYVLTATKPLEPVALTTLQQRLQRCRGDVDVKFHDFRRTVATSLAENDVPEGIIDRIMGWAPRTVGSRYYIRRADTKLQQAILKLYADDPLTTGAAASRRAAVAGREVPAAEGELALAPS